MTVKQKSQNINRQKIAVIIITFKAAEISVTPQDHRETRNGRVTSPKDGAFHRQLHVGRQKGKGGQIPLSSTFPLEHKNRKVASYKAFLVAYGNCQTVRV